MPRHDLAQLKALAPIAEIAGRSVTWHAGKSNFARGDLWACCPFHQERTPSFHVDTGKGVFKCFGCGAGGDVFAFVQQLYGLDFAGAVGRLAQEVGLAPSEGARPRPAPAAPVAPPREAEDLRERVARAFELWSQAEPASGVLLDYLRARGVDLEALDRRAGGVPPTLRLHPALEHHDKDAAGRWRVHCGPAMIARIGRGQFEGVHRTWITPTGRARWDDGAKLAKRMLGTGYGPGVRFCAPTDRMVAGEGIETTLVVWSRLLARGEDGWSAEAALSRDALCGPGDPAFEGPELNPYARPPRPAPSPVPDWRRVGWSAPSCVDQLVVLAEGSSKDPVTAERLTRRAVARHAVRPDGRPRRCSYRLPGGDWGRDLDFADLAAEAAA